MYFTAMWKCHRPLLQDMEVLHNHCEDFTIAHKYMYIYIVVATFETHISAKPLYVYERLASQGELSHDRRFGDVPHDTMAVGVH